MNEPFPGNIAECTNSLKPFRITKCLVPTALLPKFTGHSEMPLVKSSLIALNMFLKMITCQSHRKRYYLTLTQREKNILKNWRPISLLNNDYKSFTKALALRLEKSVTHDE